MAKMIVATKKCMYILMIINKITSSVDQSYLFESLNIFKPTDERMYLKNTVSYNGIGRIWNFCCFTIYYFYSCVSFYKIKVISKYFF